MANIPQNNQYESNPSQPSPVDFSRISKEVKKNTQQDTSNNVKKAISNRDTLPPINTSSTLPIPPINPTPIQNTAVGTLPTTPVNTPVPNMFDGKGGPLDAIGNFLQHPFGESTQTYVKQPPTSFNVRGVNINESQIPEMAQDVFGEVSNRPGKQAFETQNIINTALNRTLANKNYKGSVINALQAPNQYQGYAPNGVMINGKNTESQYQKLLNGLKNNNLDEPSQNKYKTILDTLNQMKSGKFPDITGGKQFYTHASDGSLWLGRSINEAKQLATQHEQQLKLKTTQWGTANGLPAPSNEIAQN